MVDSSVDAVGLFSAVEGYTYRSEGGGKSLYPSSQLVLIWDGHGINCRILMVAIILVCIGFGTSTHLTNAYGMTGSSATRFELIISRHGHDSHNPITHDGYVFCMGLRIYSPACFPSLLRCPRRRILGLYRSPMVAS